MVPKIDYEELKERIRRGDRPEGLDPDVTVQDIEAFEKEFGQPEDAPKAVFTEAESEEFERKVWARIREEEKRNPGT